MTCYDLDTFRAFVDSGPFNDLYRVPEAEREAMLGDTLAAEQRLLQFGYRFLRQVLFGEQSIDLDQDSVEKRRERLHEQRQREEREAAEKMARDEGFYE
jgi:hypothetical protein